MTIFGADWSNHDWGRGPMDVGAAVRDGISFATHKVAEGSPGWYVDPYFDDWWARARGVVPLPGAYYVNHPGDQISQADFFLSQLDSRAPGWRDLPAFILQVDAEKFDYMSRAPSLAEIQAFCDRLVSRTGGRHRPVVYAPGWLYGNTLAGLGYPLWESDYGTNPTTHYRSAYPGDGSSRWAPYSGQTPAILQYGSRTTIGSQTICDANAFRGTLDQLTSLLTGDDVSLQDIVPATGNRPADVCLSDIWNAVATGHSGYIPTQPQHLNAQLNRLEAVLAAIAGKVDIDPQELAQIEAAAKAGTEAAMAAKADEFVARILAGLPEGTLTRADVEAALRDVIGSVRLTPGA